MPYTVSAGQRGSGGGGDSRERARGPELRLPSAVFWGGSWVFPSPHPAPTSICLGPRARCPPLISDPLWGMSQCPPCFSPASFASSRSLPFLSGETSRRLVYPKPVLRPASRFLPKASPVSLHHPPLPSVPAAAAPDSALGKDSVLKITRSPSQNAETEALLGFASRGCPGLSAMAGSVPVGWDRTCSAQASPLPTQRLPGSHRGSRAVPVPGPAPQASPGAPQGHGAAPTLQRVQDPGDPSPKPQQAPQGRGRAWGWLPPSFNTQQG